MASDDSDLGPCCICKGAGAVNIVMLPHPAPIEGRGWGCITCGLPMNGAVAVLCDRCLPTYSEDPGSLKFVCCGYPGSDGRMPAADLDLASFDHDDAKHQESAA